MISTVPVASDTIWRSACVVALALPLATPSRHRRARLRALATRRVGKMRTRCPATDGPAELLHTLRYGWERPRTLVRSSRRILSSLPALLYLGVSKWFSGTYLALPHVSATAPPPPFPPLPLTPSEWSFTEADAVDEGRRRRQRGLRSQEARQGRSGHGEPRTIGHEEFTILHSNVRGFISRVAELSARLLLMERKLSVLCLTEAWADKGLQTMRMEGYALYPGMTVHTADWEADWLCSLWSGLPTGSPSSRIPRSQSAVWVMIHSDHGPYVIGCWYRPPAPGEVDTIRSFKKKGTAACCERRGLCCAGRLNIYHQKWLKYSNRNSLEGQELSAVCKELGLTQLVREPTSGAHLFDFPGMKAGVLPLIAYHKLVTATLTSRGQTRGVAVQGGRLGAAPRLVC